LHIERASRILGIIPARGGSRSIPRKNIQPLLGKPLIVYSIEAALASQRLTWVVTSTEDEEIAQIARAAGSDLVKRPMELALDATPTLPVVQHAIRQVEEELGYEIDYGILLQPTAPLRTAVDICEALTKLIDTQADSIVSVCRILDSSHPVKSKRISADRLEPYCTGISVPEGTRRQDLPPAYRTNGAIYAFRRNVPMRHNTLIGAVCRPYIMPQERSIDIDDEIDLKLVEMLLRERKVE
jgi:CMP-N,N'-diacetyllegionaminic acid synthase